MINPKAIFETHVNNLKIEYIDSQQNKEKANYELKVIQNLTTLSEKLKVI